MKNFTAILVLLGCLSFQNATAQIKLPAASTAQTIKQEFGMGSIEITYSRPGAKGRNVFGDLVPYGKLWRTGANAATTLKFSAPVEIGGKKLDTGTYVLYTIPNEDSWEVIINKGLKNWGVDGYKETEDIVRFKVPAIKLKTKIETLTLQIANIKADTCHLEIMWEKRGIDITITADINEKLKAQFDAAMLTDKKPYWQAAQFYFEYDKNLPKALEYITKATEENPKAFYMFLYKAKIQKEMGNIAGAMESSKASLFLAKEAKNEDYVRMNEKLQKELKKL